MSLHAEITHGDFTNGSFAVLVTLVSFITVGCVWETAAKKRRWMQVSPTILSDIICLNRLWKYHMVYSLPVGQQLCLYIHTVYTIFLLFPDFYLFLLLPVKNDWQVEQKFDAKWKGWNIEQNKFLYTVCLPGKRLSKIYSPVSPVIVLLI